MISLKPLLCECNRQTEMQVIYNIANKLVCLNLRASTQFWISSLDDTQNSYHQSKEEVDCSKTHFIKGNKLYISFQRSMGKMLVLKGERSSKTEVNSWDFLNAAYLPPRVEYRVWGKLSCNLVAYAWTKQSLVVTTDLDSAFSGHILNLNHKQLLPNDTFNHSKKELWLQGRILGNLG